MGSEKPDLGSGRPDLGSERPDLGSGRPDLRSEKSDLGSERSNLESKRPDLGSERLGEGGTDGRKTETRPEKIALCGIIGQRPLRGRCPSDHLIPTYNDLGALSTADHVTLLRLLIVSITV